MQNLTKEGKQPPVVILSQAIVTKNHQNFRPKCSPCAEGPKLGVWGTSEGRNFACFFG